MGQVSSALGLGSQIDYQGQTYNLSPWTYEIQGQFELYLQEHAMKSAKQLGKYLDPVEAKNLILETKRDIDVGEYSFGGTLLARAVSSVQHLPYLTWLMIRKNHKEVKLELVKQMFKEDFERILDKVNEANSEGADEAPLASEQEVSQ